MSCVEVPQVTALAGYAGSTCVGPGGLVCYHGGPAGTVYEGLGDCEVVQVLVLLCVCVCARARVCVCVCVCIARGLVTLSLSPPLLLAALPSSLLYRSH